MWLNKLSVILRALDEHRHFTSLNTALKKNVTRLPGSIPPAYLCAVDTYQNTFLAIKGERGLNANFPLEFLLALQMGEKVENLENEITLLYKFQDAAYEPLRKFLFETHKPPHIGIWNLNQLQQLSMNFSSHRLNLSSVKMSEILVTEKEGVNYTRHQTQFEQISKRCLTLVKSEFAKIYNIDRCIFYIKAADQNRSFDVITRQIKRNLILYLHHKLLEKKSMVIKNDVLFINQSTPLDNNFITIYMSLKFTQTEHHDYIEALKDRSISNRMKGTVVPTPILEVKVRDLTYRVKTELIEKRRDILVNMAEKMDDLDFSSITFHNSLVLPDYSHISQDFDHNQRMGKNDPRRLMEDVYSKIKHIVYNGDIYDIYLYTPKEGFFYSTPLHDKFYSFLSYIPADQVFDKGNLSQMYLDCFEPTNPLINKRIIHKNVDVLEFEGR